MANEEDVLVSLYATSVALSLWEEAVKDSVDKGVFIVSSEPDESDTEDETSEQHTQVSTRLVTRASLLATTTADTVAVCLDGGIGRCETLSTASSEFEKDVECETQTLRCAEAAMKFVKQAPEFGFQAELNAHSNEEQQFEHEDDTVESENDVSEQAPELVQAYALEELAFDYVSAVLDDGIKLASLEPSTAAIAQFDAKVHAPIAESSAGFTRKHSEKGVKEEQGSPTISNSDEAVHGGEESTGIGADKEVEPGDESVATLDGQGVEQAEASIAVSNCQEKVPQEETCQLPAGSRMQPCVRPCFGRVFCPRGPAARGGSLGPKCTLVETPVPRATSGIDWSVILLADLQAEAAEAAASSKASIIPPASRAPLHRPTQGEGATAARSEAPASAPPATAESAAAPPPEADVRPDSTAGPMNFSKPRRRVIGGVVRSAAEMEKAPATCVSGRWGSPASAAGSASHLRALQHTSKSKAHFRMDLTDVGQFDAKDPAASAALRKSSLTRGYDALGVEFHCLEGQHGMCRASLGKHSSQGGLSKASLPPPAPRLRGPLGAASALVIDLGGESRSSWGREGLSTSDLSRSSSLGSVRIAKQLQHQANVPAPPRSGSVAWSVHMARSAAKRNGQAAVF